MADVGRQSEKPVKKTRGRRGDGMIYLRPDSAVWWVKIPVVGNRPVRESTGKTKEGEARAYLKIRRAELQLGMNLPDSRKITVGSLIEESLKDMRMNKRRSVGRCEEMFRLHVGPAFSRTLASKLTTAALRQYAVDRQAQGAANGTINRELAVIKRAYNMAIRETPPRVSGIPYIPMLNEDNVRKGFLKIEEYLTLASNCSLTGKWLRGLFETGYTFGFRSEEVVKLQVAKLDMVNRAVRLDDTKNDDSRLAYMTQNLYQALLPLVEGKQPQDYVFTREDGSRVVDFRKAWWEACTASGLGRMYCRACKASSASSCWCAQCHSDNIGYEGLLYHDLRRTAIRNMRRREVQEGAAMLISGHKTRDVFERYNIVDETDLREARDRMQQGEEAEMDRLREYEGGLDSRTKVKAQLRHSRTKSGRPFRPQNSGKRLKIRS